VFRSKNGEENDAVLPHTLQDFSSPTRVKLGEGVTREYLPRRKVPLQDVVELGVRRFSLREVATPEFAVWGGVWLRAKGRGRPRLQFGLAYRGLGDDRRTQFFGLRSAKAAICDCIAFIEAVRVAISSATVFSLAGWEPPPSSSLWEGRNRSPRTLPE